jgi:hypothetical protein
VIPAEAKAQTAVGAMAFVRHYFAVVDYAYTTGETAPLAAISDPECLTCTQIMNQIGEASSKDQTYERAPTTISTVNAPLAEGVAAVEIDVTYSSTGLSLIDDSGVALATTSTITDQSLRFILVWSDRTWLVHNYREVL